jgi:hypothetical protein
MTCDAQASFHQPVVLPAPEPLFQIRFAERSQQRVREFPPRAEFPQRCGVYSHERIQREPGVSSDAQQAFLLGLRLPVDKVHAGRELGDELGPDFFLRATWHGTSAPFTCDETIIRAGRRGSEPEALMTSEREISIDMAEDEWSAIMNEADTGDHILSAAARAAMLSAAPGGGIARWFTCSVPVAHELLPWYEAAAVRWVADDPEGAAVLDRAAKNIRFALWRVGDGPPP